MLIWKSTHDAAIAAKDAEIAGLMKRIETMRSNMVLDDAYISELQVKLARYTAPRERGEGGRFLPLKQVQA